MSIVTALDQLYVEHRGIPVECTEHPEYWVDQLKFMRERLAVVADTVSQLVGRFQEFEGRLSCQAPSTELWRERFRAETLSLARNTAVEAARRDVLQVIERVDAVSQLIHSERDLRDAAKRGLEQQIQALREAFEAERSTSEQGAVPMAADGVLLEEVKRQMHGLRDALDTERSTLRANSSQHLTRLESMERALQEEVRARAALGEQLGRSIAYVTRLLEEGSAQDVSNSVTARAVKPTVQGYDGAAEAVNVRTDLKMPKGFEGGPGRRESRQEEDQLKELRLQVEKANHRSSSNASGGGAAKSKGLFIKGMLPRAAEDPGQEDADLPTVRERLHGEQGHSSSRASPTCLRPGSPGVVQVAASPVPDLLSRPAGPLRVAASPPKSRSPPLCASLEAPGSPPMVAPRDPRRSTGSAGQQHWSGSPCLKTTKCAWAKGECKPLRDLQRLIRMPSNSPI